MYLRDPLGGGYIKPVAPERLRLRSVFESGGTVPQITTTMSVDMSATIALRRELKPVFAKAAGLSLGFMPFLIKAVARALRAAPEINASLTPEGLWLHDRIRLAVSIATRRGVNVPVICDPDRKSLAAVTLELEDKTSRARHGLMEPDDYLSPTFGLTNPGSLGIECDVPMVVPPHVATLSCCAIQERPVVVAGQVLVRPLMNANLSFDHRALDGAEASAFLKSFRKSLEHGLVD